VNTIPVFARNFNPYKKKKLLSGELALRGVRNVVPPLSHPVFTFTYIEYTVGVHRAKVH
jgi:hypothetical protein